MLIKRNNHISEYLGSHIFELLGFEAQDTYLGMYEDEQVVACKNFVSGETQFVPFNDVGESSLEQDKETYQYSYQEIMQMLRDNVKLTSVEETISMFWDIYVVDALIGNFDRHGGNWGFLKKNNKYTLAPVFDNGSCLSPELKDEEESNIVKLVFNMYLDNIFICDFKNKDYFWLDLVFKDRQNNLSLV